MKERKANAPQELSRLLVEQALAYAIIFLDREGRIVNWNRGAAALFGYAPEEAVGKHIDLIFTPEDVRGGAAGRQLETAVRTGHVLEGRWQQRKDGSRFFGIGAVTALRDPAGEVIAFSKIVRDATGEKNAEEERAASERRLRAIVDGVRDYAIYMLDTEGRILTWSRGAQQLKQYTPEEVIGRNFEIFYPAEDVAAGKPRKQLRIAAEEGMYEDESTHVRKDGTPFSAHVVVSALRDERGELRGFVNLTHDVTEIRRARERLAFLAEASRVLSSSIDYEETLRRIARIAVPHVADSCAVELLTDGERALSGAAVEHVDPAKVALAIRERKTIFHEDVGVRSVIVTPLIAADRVLGTMTLVTTGERRLSEADISMAEDIAARAAIAVQNAQLYREAQDANRAKDDFLATVSHELRTPMTAILGWAKLLRTSQLDAATIDEATSAIERSAAAQAQLIDDILDVARIRVGKLRMRFEQTNLAAVVDNAISTVQFAAEAKHIRLRVERSRRMLPVRGDPQRLQQVVWNLLSNAIKFTPENGIVEVTIEESDGVARIIVRDTGMGISPEFLPHLFERFRQAESSQSRGHGGLGLGLSIAHYIVTAHGGTIRAESGKDGGATFVVELPRLQDAETRQPRAASGRQVEEARLLRGVSVLVVEDDDMALRLFCVALERAGAQCRAASSVDEALRLFDARVPDIIVSDIAMPEKTGYDLAHEIRERDTHVPIVAVTASGAGADRERALSNGFNAYLRKPVEPQVLVDTVRDRVEAARG